MTREQEARQIFSDLMQEAKHRQLTWKEKQQLSWARQQLRGAKKVRNPKKLTRAKARQILHEGVAHGRPLTPRARRYFGARASGYPRRNPQEPVLIYGKVQTIYAQKTQSHICDAECEKHGHRYFHDFTSKAKMYGLPDGSILIKP